MRFDPRPRAAGRVDRRSASAPLTVKASCDLSEQLSECTVAAGDNGAYRRSPAECRHFYANEVGDKNKKKRQKKKKTSLAWHKNQLVPLCVEFPPLLFLFFCHAHTLIWLNSGDRKTCGTSRRDGIILFFAPAGDGDVDRKCQL